MRRGRARRRDDGMPRRAGAEKLGATSSDMLYLDVGGWGTESREYLVARNGDSCDVSVRGYNTDATSARATVPSPDIEATLIASAPWADWGHGRWGRRVMDGSSWALRVRWGDIDVDAGGRMGGPEGYQGILDDIETALCIRLGVPPRRAVAARLTAK